LNHPAVLIVGNRSDPHAEAVADKAAAHLPGRVLVVDAQRLSRAAFTVDPAAAPTLTLPGEPTVRLDRPMRGWLRRVAPDSWDHGIALGSRDAAIRTAWLSLLSGIVRTSNIRWLTPPAAAAIAENKIVQYAAAATLGIDAPETLLTSDPNAVQRLPGDRVVVKPLGPGEIRDRDTANAVFAQSLSADDPRLALLDGAPFIAQQRIEASRHLRVVTVGKRAWSAAIDVDNDTPLDWRQAPAAHRRFQRSDEPDVVDGAVRLAGHLDVGYSSQDWIIDTDGRPFFVDLNPGGQWLFLPDADEVSDAIAAWLSKDDT
jgi:hypothetical protein